MNLTDLDKIKLAKKYKLNVLKIGQSRFVLRDELERSFYNEISYQIE